MKKQKKPTVNSKQKSATEEAVMQCNDGDSQNVKCPNCLQVYKVDFNPYYKEGSHICPICNFKTSAWQFDVVVTYRVAGKSIS
jgi:hypothetical protein